jgi:hypothetical protein
MSALDKFLISAVILFVAAMGIFILLTPHEDSNIRLIQTPDGQVWTEAQYHDTFEVILRNRQTGKYLREDGSHRAPESNRDDIRSDRGPCGPIGIRGEDRYRGVESSQGVYGPYETSEPPIHYPQYGAP